MPRQSLGKTRFPASLPPDLLSRLDAIAKVQHRTRADVIQEAVEAYVSKIGRGTPSAPDAGAKPAGEGAKPAAKGSTKRKG